MITSFDAAADAQWPETPEDQASRWVARMSDPDVPPHVERQFETWIAADSRHAELYADCLAAYDAPELQTAVTTARRKDTRSWWLPAGAIAASLIAGLVVWGTWKPDAAKAPVAEHVVALTTGHGETLSAPLPDGTQIALSGDTELKVLYGSGRRTVEMTRGEAYFDVAHDPARPFVITAGKTEIQVLGTAFNTDLLPDHRVEVSVYRGQVRVGSAGRSRDLAAGDRYTDGARPVLTSFDPAVEPDWRSGWFEADNVPLSRLVDEVNRFSKVPVRVRTAAVGRLSVTGRFKVSDPAMVLKALKNGYGLSVEAGPSETLIGR